MMRPFQVAMKAAVIASGGSKAALTAALSFAASISAGSGPFGSTSPIGQGSVVESGNWLFTATGVKWTMLSPGGKRHASLAAKIFGRPCCAVRQRDVNRLVGTVDHRRTELCAHPERRSEKSHVTGSKIRR